MSQMNILVTGGAGFIGSNLVDRLLKEGHIVTAFDDLSGGYLDNLPNHPRLTFLNVDCQNFKMVDDNFINFDVVYHLAANAAENKAQFSPVDISLRGYMAAINVLTAAIRHKVPKFIFTSSIAVYGNGTNGFKETDKPEPEDLYGIGKLAFEESLKVMADVHGFEYVILRPHNVYGPKQNMADPFRNVVTIFMNSILHNRPYVLYGNGEMTRCFTYIDDIVECLYKSLKLKDTTVNVGSSTPASIKELSNLILRITNSTLEPIMLPSRPHEVMQAVSDHTLASKLFKISETPLEYGLQKTWEWVKQHGPVETKLQDIEIDSDKLPVNWKK
jgi:UDP-glucose 4-epimerase